MSIDFSTLQGLTIPEGVVTQIADAAGNVIWSAVTNKPVILEVEKITSDTYAGETTYTGEQFILLNIVPKTNGTVSVTYGGLTKTITDTSGAAFPTGQKVFFGTFNGVSDSVTTPASGTLIIEGDYRSLACGSYNISNKSTSYCNCITSVTDLGNIESLSAYAFYNCSKITSVTIPSGVTSIPMESFRSCSNLVHIDLPDSITQINNYAFGDCVNLVLTSLPDNIEILSGGAFSNCTKIALTSLPSNLQLLGASAFENCTSLSLTSLPSGVTNIADGAFNGCKNINITSIPNGVTTIGNNAFSMPLEERNGQLTTVVDTKMSEMTIPATVTSIGTRAFAANQLDDAGGSSYLGYLKKITMLGATPPTITTAATNTSFGRDMNTIVVPKGCGDTYKAAEGWSVYSSKIVEAS